DHRRTAARVAPPAPTPCRSRPATAGRRSAGSGRPDRRARSVAAPSARPRPGPAARRRAATSTGPGGAAPRQAARELGRGGRGRGGGGGKGGGGGGAGGTGGGGGGGGARPAGSFRHGSPPRVGRRLRAEPGLRGIYAPGGQQGGRRSASHSRTAPMGIRSWL